uniref:Taste receptor type 1 member 1 n=1 Tax=Mesocestoides corti TaxID=53468 RepID=A0A5K3ETI8_MESCO
CCESCLFTLLNPVAPPLTQGSPSLCTSPAARILNSPLIRTDIYLGASPHPGPEVPHIRGVSTHTQTPHMTQRHQRG